MKDGRGKIVVLHIHGHRAFPVGAHDEGVEIVDIDFCFDQRRGDEFEIRFGAHFHSENFTFRKSMPELAQEVPCWLRIVGDKSHDRAFSRIQLGKRHDMDVMLGKPLDKLVEPPDFVVGEDGKLQDRFPFSGLQGI